MLQKQKFQTLKEFLTFVATEADLQRTETQIQNYKQAWMLNEKQLSQAEKDAQGREKVDVAALKEVCTLQEQAVKKCQEAVNTLGNRNRPVSFPREALVRQRLRNTRFPESCMHL